MALAGLALLPLLSVLLKAHKMTFLKLATKVNFLIWPLPPPPPEANYQSPE